MGRREQSYLISILPKPQIGREIKKRKIGGKNERTPWEGQRFDSKNPEQKLEKGRKKEALVR